MNGVDIAIDTDNKKELSEFQNTWKDLEITHNKKNDTFTFKGSKANLKNYFDANAEEGGWDIDEFVKYFS